MGHVTMEALTAVGIIERATFTWFASPMPTPAKRFSLWAVLPAPSPSYAGYDSQSYQ